MRPCGLPGCVPKPHQPDRVEAEGGDALKLGLRHVGQGNKTSGLAAQFLEPSPGVDFVDDRIYWPGGHWCFDRTSLNRNVTQNNNPRSVYLIDDTCFLEDEEPQSGAVALEV